MATPRSLDQLVEQARLVSLRSDWDQALELWTSVYEQNPALMQPVVAIGKILQQQTRYDEAEVFLQRELPRFLSEPDVAICLAELERHRQAWGEAAKHWQVLEARCPDDACVVSGLAQALWALDSEAALEFILHRLGKIQPGSVTAENLRPRLEIRRGRAADAVVRLNAFEAKSPGKPHILDTLEIAKAQVAFDSEKQTSADKVEAPADTRQAALSCAPNNNLGPILVIGMHRSGTSATAGLLARLGVHFGAAGELLPPDHNNAEGYFELGKAVECNDLLLDRANGAWDLPPTRAEGLAKFPADLAQQAQAALAPVIDAAAAAGQVWGFKDPRMCLTWRAWLELIPGARIVVCLRDPLAVARSLGKRGSSSIRFGQQLCEHYFNNVLAIPPDRIVAGIRYEDLMEDGQAVIHKLIAALELSPTPNQLSDALGSVKSSLRHNRDTLDSAPPSESGARVEAAYRRMRELVAAVTERVTDADFPAPV